MDDGATRFYDERARVDGTRCAWGEPPSADEPPKPPLGATMGRFVILGTLGAGGMGVVHSAYDPELDRKIAIKLLKSAGAREKARARLRREAQALARLNHPNVVTVYDVGVHAGGVFVAMEFVKGQTVGEWIREGPIDHAELLRVFRAAARGLAAAHETGLVHRDFKPESRGLPAEHPQPAARPLLLRNRAFSKAMSSLRGPSWSRRAAALATRGANRTLATRGAASMVRRQSQIHEVPPRRHLAA